MMLYSSLHFVMAVSAQCPAVSVKAAWAGSTRVPTVISSASSAANIRFFPMIRFLSCFFDMPRPKKIPPHRGGISIIGLHINTAIPLLSMTGEQKPGLYKIFPTVNNLDRHTRVMGERS